MAQIVPLSRKLPITSLAILPSSEHVLAGSGTCLLAISCFTKEETAWNVLSKNRIHVILPQTGTEFVFLAGGQEVVYGLCDPSKGAFDTLCKRHLHDWVLAAAYLSSTHIILATASNTVLVLSLPDLVTTQTIYCDERPFLWSAAFTQKQYETLQEVKLAVGTIMQNVLIWSPFVSTSVKRHTGHDGSIFGVAFSPSGKEVASVSDDRTLRVWSTSSGEPEVLWGHQDRVWRVIWVDEETIASAGQDAVVLLWKRREGTWTVDQRWAGHDRKHVWSLAVHKGKVLSGGADSSIRFWDSRDNVSSTLAQDLLASDTSPDGQTIVFLTKDRQLCVVEDVCDLARRTIASLPEARSGADLHLDIANDLVWVVCKNGQMTCCSINCQKDIFHCCVDQVMSRSKLQILSDASRRLLAYDAKLKTISCFALEPFENPVLLFSLLVPFVRPISFFRLSPIGKYLFLGDGWGKLAIYLIENDTLKNLVSDKLHQDGVTDLLVLKEDEDHCVFETVSRDGRWCRHALALGSENMWTLNTTMTVSVGYDRLEKIALVDSKRILVAQSSGRFTLYNTFGEKLSSYPCSEPPPPHWQLSISEGHCQLVQLSKGILSTARWPISNLLQPSCHGRELRCVSSFNYSDTLSLLASTSENSTLRISQITPDGNLVPLAVETGLRDNAKALNWICTDPALYLLVTGVRELVQCYQVTIVQPGYLEDVSLELKLIAEDKMASSLADVRIVDSDAHWSEDAPLCVNLFSGYSEGTLTIRKLDLKSKTWRTVSSLTPDPAHPRCILSVKHFSVSDSQQEHHIVATGSSNGSVVLWDVTSCMAEAVSTSNDKQPLLILTMHQSGVDSLDISVNSSHITIASGGDDNKLSVRKLSIHDLFSPLETSAIAAFEMPSAHASAIQGVRFLDADTIVAASWDQRCTLWRIKEDGLIKLASQMSQVADCSSMDVLPLSEREVLVTMAGTGSESLRVKW